MADERPDVMYREDIITHLNEIAKFVLAYRARGYDGDRDVQIVQMLALMLISSDLSRIATSIERQRKGGIW